MPRKFYREDNVTIPAIAYELNQPVGFTEITDANELKVLYIEKYRQREYDGKTYFEDFRACLMLDILNGIYTEQQAFDLENHLYDLTCELYLGNWLTAQNINQNLALSGIYDQVMKDEIQLKIDNYVTENY